MLDRPRRLHPAISATSSCWTKPDASWGTPHLHAEAERRARCILAEAERAGDYRWDGSGGKQLNLGLFRGLAGIGYTMLRRVSPTLPNVLTWA